MNKAENRFFRTKDDVQKVYVITIFSHSLYGNYPFGVFSTLEEAENYMKNKPEPDLYNIQEFVVL